MIHPFINKIYFVTGEECGRHGLKAVAGQLLQMNTVISITIFYIYLQGKIIMLECFVIIFILYKGS